MSAKSFYDKFDGRLDKKKFAGDDQNIKVGKIDPEKVVIPTVDGNKKIGNPRLWNQHKLLLANGFKGALTDAKMMGLLNIKETLNLGRTLIKTIAKLSIGLIKSREPAEPIILNHKGEAVEGMRRVIASRLLKQSGNSDFDTIPCIVLSPEVTDEQILAHIALIHIAKKVTWESINRAASAASFRDEHNWPIQEIATHFGWNNRQVVTYLKTHDYVTAYQAKYGDFTPKIFTMMYKLASNKKLENMMSDISHDLYDPNLKANFFRWVNEKKIKDCRHVHDLVSDKKDSGILFSKQAVAELEKKGSAAAIKWLVQHDFNATDSFFHSLARIATEAGSLNEKDIAKFDSGLVSQLEATIYRLQNTLMKCKDSLKSKAKAKAKKTKTSNSLVEA